MFKKLALLALVSVCSLEANAQQRTIVTSAPSAQEYVDLLFKAEEPKIKTRGIQVFQQPAPAVVAAPAAPPVAVAAPVAPVQQPAPIPVAAAPSQPKIVAAPVRFALDSAAVPKSFEPYLLNLAEALKRPEAAGKVVIVSGHTDSKGNDAYNMALSARRARSVEQFLIRNGVGAEQVVSTGRGETQLIPGHETEDALNRRVEFSVASF